MRGMIREQARDIPVYDRCDILVVGGGSAGHTAAIAAARAGARNIIILERYGFMGGDVTGGYVILLPNLSWYDKSFIRGIQEEWFSRLDRIPGASRGPSLEDIGKTDRQLIDRWRGMHDCVSRGTYAGCKPPCIVRTMVYEPNQLKLEMDNMLAEHSDSIRILYHSWAAAPIMENNEIKGVIFESKEGRRAILAKVIIDATGDGDIYSQTGTPFQTLADGECRSSTSALVWRVGGIDWDKYSEWRFANPEKDAAFRDRLSEIAGHRAAPICSNDNSIMWINNWHPGKDVSRVRDLTDTELETRTRIRPMLEHIREAVPAFRDAFLYDIAPQLGARCSRRLSGEYLITANDFAFALRHDDVIAWSTTICQINDCGPVEIPYRAILARRVDNLLAPGRHLSADNVAIDWINLIPQCVQTGQAAGVAAAVAVTDGTGTHGVDIKKVQDILVDQDVPLPRSERFRAKDPTYDELAAEKQYGLYTEMARRAREEAGGSALRGFRQW